MSTPDEFARAVGHRIREYRKERGLTQEQLADKVGASRSLISCYENGKFSPNGFSLVRLADALGVRTDQLLYAKAGDTFKQLDHWLLRIPTVDTELSMNLGQAVALCLYELARDPKAAEAKPDPIRSANAGQTEQITLRLLKVLERSGYTNALTAASTEDKVRRLVRRLDIAGKDVPVLLGMLRQILWKVEN